jgi:hypothetical protein
VAATHDEFLQVFHAVAVAPELLDASAIRWRSAMMAISWSMRA